MTGKTNVVILGSLHIVPNLMMKESKFLPVIIYPKTFLQYCLLVLLTRKQLIGSLYISSNTHQTVSTHEARMLEIYHP